MRDHIFNKVALQSMKRSRPRTVVTIIGVILSVAMFTAVTTFISSLQNWMIENVVVEEGDWHGAFLNVDSAFVKEISRDAGVQSAAMLQNIGYAPLEESENPGKPFLFISGYSKEAFSMRPVKLLSGRLPENGGEIVVSEHIEQNGGVVYSIGDTLTLDVGRRVINGETLDQTNPYMSDDGEVPPESFQSLAQKTYQVVGVCARPAFEPYSAPGYTVFTDMGPAADGNFDLYFKLKHPPSVYQFVEENAGNYGVIYHNDLLRFMGVSRDDAFTSTLYPLAAILSILIMVGSVLLIYNSFSISVSERARQFGILSSVGATKKQLRKSVLFEGFLIGLIGILPGILVGVAGIGVTLWLLGDVFGSISYVGVPLSLSVSVPALAIAAMLGMTTILISAYIPARRAAARSVMENIRQASDVKVTARAFKTSRLTQKIFGLEGTLALKSFKRNRRRYRSTVLSLFVSVVLFISASAFGMYLKQGLSMSVMDAGYDLMFRADGLSEQEMLPLYEKLKNAEGVTGGGYYLGTQTVGQIPLNMLSDPYKTHDAANEIADGDTGQNAEAHEMYLDMSFVDEDTYARYLEDLGLPVSEYTGENAKLLAVAKIHTGGGGERYASFDILNTKSLSVKIASVDSLADYYEGAAEEMVWKDACLTVVDQLPESISGSIADGFKIIAPYSLKSHYGVGFGERALFQTTFLSAHPAATETSMENIVAETVALDKNDYYIFNLAEELEANRRIILVVNVFTYGFVILISLIATANVFNTVSTSISLRRREFAMLRSVGMTDDGFNRMINYECVFYGLKALLYGLPIAAAITFLIHMAVSNGAETPYMLPWVSVGISIFSVFFVVFVTMLYAAGKIKTANVIDALRDDI